MIVIHFDTNEISVIADMAKKAEIGGNSHIRDTQDRRNNLHGDQLTGQLAEAALHRYWYGPMWRDSYTRSRNARNLTPWKGDGGSDLPGTNIDIKGSLIRTKLPKEQHRLIVRPPERHNGSVYILALVEFIDNGADVSFMGWASDSELPNNPEPPGAPFGGAYVLQCHQLHPLIPVRWKP